jgi:hypothetical protein
LNKSLAQILDLARCFPPQPEGGEFPGREFAEVPEESTSAATTMLHIETKRKKSIELNRVEDSEDLDGHNFSSDGDDDTVILAKPLASRPPPPSRKKGIPNFALETS